MLSLPGKNMPRLLRKGLKEPGYAIQACRRRMMSYINYKIRNGYSSLPETISLFLTHRCNLRCKQCGQWGVNGTSRTMNNRLQATELSLTVLTKFVDEIHTFKPAITLFGGEPFLYRDWLPLVQHIKKRKLRVNVVTNGTLLHKNIAAICRSGLDEIIISLDGPRDIHDAIKNKPGSYDKIFAGIDNTDLGGKTLVNITTVITPENFAYLTDIADIAEQVNANSVTFHHLTFISRSCFEEFNNQFKTYFNHTCADWAGFIADDLPDIDPQIVIKQQQLLKNRRGSVDISFYPNLSTTEIEQYYSDWRFTPQSYPARCISPWMVAYIFPDGSVRPFHTMDYPMGNIYENSFSEIWNGSRYRKYRTVLKKVGHFPVCTRCTEFYRY